MVGRTLIRPAFSISTRPTFHQDRRLACHLSGCPSQRSSAPHGLKRSIERATAYAKRKTGEARKRRVERIALKSAAVSRVSQFCCPNVFSLEPTAENTDQCQIPPCDRARFLCCWHTPRLHQRKATTEHWIPHLATSEKRILHILRTLLGSSQLPPYAKPTANI